MPLPYPGASDQIWVHLTWTFVHPCISPQTLPWRAVARACDTLKFTVSDTTTLQSSQIISILRHFPTTSHNLELCCPWSVSTKATSKPKKIKENPKNVQHFSFRSLADFQIFPDFQQKIDVQIFTENWGGRFRSVGLSYLTLSECLLGGIEWGPELVDQLLQEGTREMKLCGEDAWVCV